MMDTPSRGGAITSSENMDVQKDKVNVGNVDEFNHRKSQIVGLRKCFTASKQESMRFRAKITDDDKIQAENKELRTILEFYKSKYGLLQNPDPQEESKISSKEKTKSMAETPNQITDQHSGKAKQDVPPPAGEYGNMDVDMEWSFTEIESNTADITLRSSLLEMIYDMARSSEEFKMQLVDNLIVLLKFKELSVEEPSEKSALQESIDVFTKARDGPESNLEADIDDLDKRVSECFAGISEFHAFRKHFKEELEEIKRMNEINLDSPSKISFGTQKAPQKSSLKSNPSSTCVVNGNRVQFEESNLSRVSSVLNHKLSPGTGNPCKDCSRYRALLKSFQTAQEADRQKQKKQEQTIEKLSTAITSTKRYPRLSSVHSEQRMELLRSLDRSDSDLEEPVMRLQFDSPMRQYDTHGSGGHFKSRLTIESAGSGDRSRFQNDRDNSVAHLGASDLEVEKQLHLENVQLLTKVSELEQRILKLQYFSPSKNAEDENVARKLAQVTHDLNQTTLELADLRMKFRRAEEEKAKLREEFSKTNEDLDLALEDLERYEVALKKEKSINQNLRETSVLSDPAAAELTQPGSPSPSSSALSNYATKKYDLTKDYERLRMDFDQVVAICEEFQKKNVDLENKIASLNRHAPLTGEVLDLKKELRTSEETIASLRKELETSASRLKNLDEDLRKEPPELGKLRQLCAKQESELTQLTNEVRKSGLMITELEKTVDSQRTEITMLKEDEAQLLSDIQDEKTLYSAQKEELLAQAESLRTEMDRMSVEMKHLHDERARLVETGEKISKGHESERKNLRDALLSHDRKIKEMACENDDSAGVGFDIGVPRTFVWPESRAISTRNPVTTEEPAHNDTFLSKIFGGRKNREVKSRKPRRSKSFTGHP